MRQGSVIPRTRRADPRDAASPGTRLLIRGGFIEQVGRGLWILGPLGLRARRQAERIVREEMEHAGAIEVELPILQPREFWEETDRWRKYEEAGLSFRIRDRTRSQFLLAPTAEEVVTHFARRHLPTHRDLPVTLWQMGPKFRDEIRPRQGLVRCREFLMKDAYSFDADAEGMRRSYETMRVAYDRIMKRCGFDDFVEVQADSGQIGGAGSAEFMAVTAYGEDTLLCCPDCGYGGNQEKAAAHFPPCPESEPEELRLIDTPDIKTIEALEEFTGLGADRMLKTIVLLADGQPVVVSMRGDLDISEVKLAGLLGASAVETADPGTVEAITKAPVGFAGPIGLWDKTEVPYLFDRSVECMRNFLCGANRKDAHYLGVVPERDLPPIDDFRDLSMAVEGQLCPHCSTGRYVEKRGIELGHVFQLQQVYSMPMEATYADAAGEHTAFWMGCYGIGVSRIVQATVEQHHDERGIIWPWSLAPFQVAVIPANAEKHLSAAEEIYEGLKEAGLRVLLDDRPARIGEKLTDAELLGWPAQVVVGRSWENEKKVELRWRDLRDWDAKIFEEPRPGSLPTAVVDLEEAARFLKEHTEWTSD